MRSESDTESERLDGDAGAVRSHLSDRIAGTILLVVAVLYWWHAGSYAVSFGDPAGPSLFPRVVAVPFGLLSLYLILRPDPDPMWLQWPQAARQVALLAVLVLYPLAIEPMGFPISTFLGTLLLAIILGATWLQAVLTGLGVGLGLFFLFDGFFGLPLPPGPIFG